MSANDPGCVKTRKIRESREYFFLHQLKSDMLANICAPKRGLDKRLFYRRHASLSFYTAKTQSDILDRHVEVDNYAPTLQVKTLTASVRSLSDATRSCFSATLLMR
jgi:hypothetical protein